MGRTATLIVLGAVAACIYAAPRGIGLTTRKGNVTRIVSLLPSHTELAFDAGAGDLLVGVTRACDFPPQTGRIEKIGDVRVDYEAIVKLRPDLILSSKTLMSRANHELTRLGLPVQELDPMSWDDIATALKTIGSRCGRADRGLEAAERLLRHVGEIEWRLAGVRRPSVAYLEASPQMVMAAGPGSPPDLVIRAAGGINAFGDLRRDWDWVEWEVVLLREVDVIVVPSEARAALEMRTGVRGRILEVDARIYARPGPRLPAAAEELARFLHPGRFE